MHALQLLADALERFAQALFQGVVQLFVDGLAHLLQFLAVVGLNRRQPVFQGLTQGLQALGVALHELAPLAGQLLAEGAQALALFRAPGAGILQGLVEFLVHELAQTFGLGLLLLVRGGQFFLQGAARMFRLPHQGFVEAVDGQGGFLPVLPQKIGDFPAIGGHFLAQTPFQLGIPRIDGIQLRLNGGDAGRQTDLQDDQQDE